MVRQSQYGERVSVVDAVFIEPLIQGIGAETPRKPKINHVTVMPVMRGGAYIGSQDRVATMPLNAQIATVPIEGLQM